MTRVTLISVVCVITTTELASAFSTKYFFDDTDTTGGSGTNTVLVAGSTSAVPNAQVHVRAYFSQNSGKVGILGANYCPSGNWDIGGVVSGATTQFQIGNRVKNGVYQSRNCDNAASNDWVFSFTNIDREHNSALIGETRLYFVDIVATNKASRGVSLQNGFRVYEPIEESNNNRLFVAQIGGDSGNQVTLQQAPNDGTNRNYAFRFGSDCSITTATERAVSFYDLDNDVDANGNDPSGAQRGGALKLRIYQVDDRGRQTPVQLKYYTRSDRGGQTRIGSNQWTPSGGSGITLRVYFDVQPGGRYVSRLTNVYSNNTIQFSTPFDGVYYERQCQNPGWTTSGDTHKGQTRQTPTNAPNFVSPGASISWWHQISKTGSGSAPVGTVRVSVDQYTLENGRRTSGGVIFSGPSSAFGAGDVDDIWHISRSYTTTSSDVGKMICQRIFWSPYSAATSPSALMGTYDADEGDTNNCYTVVASPAVHIRGNDVRVGSDFINTTNNRSSLITGTSYTAGAGASFGEYGVFAPGLISNFASQGGGSLQSPSASSNGLTFANIGTNGQYAPLSNLGTIPNVAGSLSSLVTDDHGSANVSLGNASAPISTMETTGVRIIRTSGTITINDNLTYRNTAGSVEGLPQLILIANNINIASRVTNVNAWLVASNGTNGVVDTCSDFTTNNASPNALRSTNCNQQLNINGPVMAKTLKLKRTYYDSSNPSSSAESITMRGDAYVVSERLAQQHSNWQTVYTTDLPPRY